ncbi:hypothetical protein [Salinispora mooreana]|uniref:hypothetical protein n=1 Tax=Salinispora mooreana TaxID=999545 RepID=UPI001CC38A64|nr:hypothetical protein [Salinispora mooreana]
MLWAEGAVGGDPCVEQARGGQGCLDMVEDGGVETVDRVEQSPQRGACRCREGGTCPAGPARWRVGDGVAGGGEVVGFGVRRGCLCGGGFRAGAQVGGAGDQW